MADNSFKINKSANFNPQPGLPTNPVDGDFYYDANVQSFVYFHNGKFASMDSVGLVTAQDPMTSAQFTPAIVQNSVVKIVSGVSPTHLTGISASFSAKRLTIYNAGTSYITVEHEDASEPTANNRIHTPTAGDMNLIAGEVAVFTYDIVQNRWLLVSISSQAGAQLIATTTSPGLVTLHQASLFPFDGIVLSDGDRNTPTGVVGLDANRAAFIAPTIGNTVALTLTGLGTGEALVATGGLTSIQTLLVTSPVGIGIKTTGGDIHSGLNAIGGSVSGPGVFTTGGGTGVGINANGGASGAAAGLFRATGFFAGLAAYGFNAPNSGTTEQHTLYGSVAIIAQAGAAGGNGIITGGVGAGFAGLRTAGGTDGHGIIADAGPIGSGVPYAGIFNGKVNVSSTLDVTGLTNLGGLHVNTSGTITSNGFSVDASGNLSAASLTTAGSFTSASVVSQNGILVDNADVYSGTFPAGVLGNIIKFGAATSGEGMGSKRTAGGNQFGLDFYTNSTSRMNIALGGAVNINNSLGIGTSLSVGSSATVGTTLTVGGLLTANGSVSIPGNLTVNGQINLDTLNPTGSGIDIFGITTLHSTVVMTNNCQINAQLNAGASGGSFTHLFSNSGSTPPISLTGARDPVGQGDGNGGFWFGSSNNLTGHGTTWRLNICIAGNVYSWNVDNIWAIL